MSDIFEELREYPDEVNENYWRWSAAIRHRGGFSEVEESEAYIVNKLGWASQFFSDWIFPEYGHSSQIYYEIKAEPRPGCDVIHELKGGHIGTDKSYYDLHGDLYSITDYEEEDPDMTYEVEEYRLKPFMELNALEPFTEKNLVIERTVGSFGLEKRIRRYRYDVRYDLLHESVKRLMNRLPIVSEGSESELATELVDDMKDSEPDPFC